MEGAKNSLRKLIEFFKRKVEGKKRGEEIEVEGERNEEGKKKRTGKCAKLWQKR